MIIEVNNMILGILGGMGPAATIEFMAKITKYSNASKDQEHIHLIVDSNTEIPDRSEYISGKGKDPTGELVRTALKLELMGADYIAIPCNTAHYFYDRISEYCRVPVISMINETANFILSKYPDSKNFFLLATEGTYAAGIYKKVFDQYKLNVLEPDQCDKKIIMNWIRKVKAGDFSVSPLAVESLVNKYTGSNERILLGCTELPLLADRIGVPKEYIDPLSVLAQRCVEIAKTEEERKESF